MRRINTHTSNKFARNFLWQVVDQNKYAFREFLGTNRIKLEPGIRICLPYVHTFKMVDMREQQSPISQISCYTKDNVPVVIGGTLFFRINDAEKALYKVHNYQQSIHEVGMSAVRSIVGQNEYDVMTRERSAVNSELYKTVSLSIKDWGIECTKFEITNFGPQNAEVAKNLEMQMKQERERRANELNTMAHINTAEGEKKKAILVAEGEKQAAILKSEGIMLSAKNTAEGDFIVKQREADARAYAIQTEAKAMAGLLDQIGSVVGPALAVEFLLKRQKYQALQAIAEGPNAKVYFMPNGNSTDNNKQNMVLPLMPILDSSNNKV